MRGDYEKGAGFAGVVTTVGAVLIYVSAPTAIRLLG
jgi:hypothetical protein